MESNLLDGSSNISNGSVGCGSLSDTQIHQAAIVRGVVAAVCSVVCLVLLVAISHWLCCKGYNSFRNRLVLYLTSFTLFNLVTYILQIAVYWEDSLSDDDVRKLCTGVGVLDQVGSWLQLLATLWSVVCFSYNYYHDSPTPLENVPILWREILPLFVMVTWAATISAVPAVSGSYGLSGGWCWIRETDDNCDRYRDGVIYQWVFWYIWVATSLIATLVLLCTGVCNALIVARHNAETLDYRRKLIHIKKTKQARALVWVLIPYLIFYFLLFAYELAIQVYATITNKSIFGMWIVFAITTPIGVLILPVLALVYLRFIGFEIKDTAGTAGNNPNAQRAINNVEMPRPQDDERRPLLH